MSKKIEISITDDELMTLLSKKLVNDHTKDELLNLLRAHLSEEYQLMQLYKVLCGLSLEPKSKIGEKHWVQVYNLNSWKMNKPLMQEEKIIQEGHVLCEIIEIKKYDESPIMISYLNINDAGEKSVEKMTLSEKALSFPEKPIEF